MTARPNLAGAVEAPLASLLAFVCQGRRATDQRRSITFMRTLLQVLFLFSAICLPRIAAAANHAEQSPAPQVILVGSGVAQPRTIPYKEGLTVTGAIAKGGGITSMAKQPVFLVRGGQPRKLAIGAMLADAKEDIQLAPWDIILVGTGTAHQ